MTLSWAELVELQVNLEKMLNSDKFEPKCKDTLKKALTLVTDELKWESSSIDDGEEEFEPIPLEIA